MEIFPLSLLVCFLLGGSVHASAPPLETASFAPAPAPATSSSFFDALFAPCFNASAWIVPSITSQCFGGFVRESVSPLDERQMEMLVDQAKENLARILTEQHELEAKIERKTNHTASLTQERSHVEQLVRDLRAVAAVQGSGAQSAHPAILRELLSEESRLPLLADQIAKKCGQIEQLKETLDDCRRRAEKARGDLRSLLQEIPKNSSLFNEANLTSNMDFAGLFDRIAPKSAERRINLRRVFRQVVSAKNVILLGSALVLGRSMSMQRDSLQEDAKETIDNEGRRWRRRWRGTDQETSSSSGRRNFLPEHLARSLLLFRPLLSSTRVLAELLLLVHDRVITRKFYQAKVLIDLIGSRLSSRQSPAWKSPGEVSSSSTPIASDTEFFNGLIRSLWRGPAGQMLESEIAMSLQASLAQLDGFASLRVQEVNLSSRPPWIRELKLLTTKSDQEIQLLCVLRWVMEEGGGFEVKGFVKPAYIPTRLRIHGFDLEFPMWCRVRLKPKASKLADAGSAMQESPITSVAIAALSPPKTRFDVSLHGSKVSAIPGLKEALQYSIGHMWRDCLVLPNKVELAISPDQLVVSQPDAVGVLRMRIVQAVELVASDWDTGQSDPYVKISLVAPGREPQVRKTKTMEATCFPVFNEQFEMFVFNEDVDRIEISVWDYDTFTSHDFLGKCEINLKKFIKQQGGRYGTWINQWKKLEGVRDSKSQIQFELWYDRFAPDVPACTQHDR